MFHLVTLKHVKGNGKWKLQTADSPGVGCITAAVLVMMTKDTLATAKFEAGHGSVTLLKLGDIRTNLLNNTHELVSQHIALLHPCNTTTVKQRRTKANTTSEVVKWECSLIYAGIAWPGI